MRVKAMKGREVDREEEGETAGKENGPRDRQGERRGAEGERGAVRKAVTRRESRAKGGMRRSSRGGEVKGDEASRQGEKSKGSGSSVHLTWRAKEGVRARVGNVTMGKVGGVSVGKRLRGKEIRVG